MAHLPNIVLLQIGDKPKTVVRAIHCFLRGFIAGTTRPEPILVQSGENIMFVLYDELYLNPWCNGRNVSLCWVCVPCCHSHCLHMHGKWCARNEIERE